MCIDCCNLNTNLQVLCDRRGDSLGCDNAWFCPVWLMSGMGEATALKLAHNGEKLVLAARRENRLQKLQEEIKKSGGQAVYKVTDVTSYEQMSNLATFVHDQFGSIDVLINNAGLMPLSALNERKIEGVGSHG